MLGWVWPPALLALVVWMTVQARRGMRTRTRFWLLYPAFAVLALVAVGGAVETVRESMDSRTQVMPGRLVDVGSHRMYLECTGSGSPTVVLANGLGERSPSWAWITPAVAQTTRVCVYDRAGQGWSDDAAPQDGVQLAADLHTLLARAGETGPYVLAGHSVGGVYAMTFAARYPAQVAGMVLVDSATPQQFTALPNYAGFYSTWGRVGPLLPSLARTGLARIMFGTGFAGLPSAARDQERAFTSTARDLSSQRVEFSQLPAAFTQAQALTTLGGKPLIVVTGREGQDAGWFAAQDALTGLSTNSVHRSVTGATHEALLYDQGHSANSSRAILDVVQALRAGAPPPTLTPPLTPHPREGALDITVGATHSATP
jgi:pimeloyl-ACP methyl ester carboxylesterase